MRLAEAQRTWSPPEAAPAPPAPTGAPTNSSGRLLEALPPPGAWIPLAQHRARNPVPPRSGKHGRADLMALVERSGLGGRGGAGFRTGRKMRAVAEGRGPRHVVANGTEGEPASGKDRLLLTRLPHLVIDGALVAAAAVGADRIVICVDRTDGAALASIRRAAAERSAYEPGGADVRIAETPPRYVAGESSALVHWLNDGPAQPTTTPPRPFQRGVDGRPTLVQNVETLAHLAQIAARGAEWFRQAGTSEEPGTTLVTVSGAVNRPAIVEVPLGAPIDWIVARAGGASEPIQALLIGGFFGTWVAADAAWNLPFSRAGLAGLGAHPGAGVIVALPSTACGLTETARLLAWFEAEGAGQCGPCLFGLADLARGSASLAGTTAAAAADVSRLRRWAGEIEGRGACHHPDGAAHLLRSALAVFARDLERHLAGQPCAGTRSSPTVAIPASVEGWR